MHALHQNLLPASAIHHSLYLSNFTPSTIYPLPKPHTTVDRPEIRVVGNLVVAGGEDLRVFEIREESVAVVDEKDHGMEGVEGGGGDEDLGDNFFDTGHAERAPVKYESKRKLHLLCQHQLHGTVTGLAAIRTIESSVDGMDRLLVSFKDAKMALLEWSRGDISTVSLHTYERCPQMTTGDLQGYTPMLRTDPLSRIAVLTLPEDSMAVLPVLQEQSELDNADNARDVPYSPSFIVALSDVSESIKNVIDILFLPGFHSPTLALLYSPQHTWSGRYLSNKDTFHIEIRTFDLSSGGSYPLLTSATALPSDSLYLVACPAKLGGVVLITATGVLHIDQSGRTTAAAVNGWWNYATSIQSDKSSESRKLSLEGSKCVFVGENDMLLVLHDGDVHQVRFEMDGRSVGTIKVDEQSSSVPPPSSIVVAGDKAVFFGCAEGDSLLAKVDLIGQILEEKEAKDVDMEVDWDEDLYGDAGATTNGVTNGHAFVATGPFNVELSPYDVLSGVGKVRDMTFGIAATDQGTRTYPQLVTIGGGSKRSTFNVFRRGIPINKRRRFNELVNTSGAWFLPVTRQSGQKFKDIPEAERTTMLFSSEGDHTRIYSLSTKNVHETFASVPEITIAAAPFFQQSCVLHVTPSSILLLDADAKVLQEVVRSDASPIINASIADPFVTILRLDGSASFFVGDPSGRTLQEASFTPGSKQPDCQAIQVFTDDSGIYRTFEAASKEVPHSASHANGSVTARTTAIRTGQKARMQLTDQQIKRLQEEKPAISAEKPSVQTAMNSSRGSQWLVVLTVFGDLQIRSLPDLDIVLQSDGVAASDLTFTDDLVDGLVKPLDEDADEVDQMLFTPIGATTCRPHLLVLHKSGRLNVYEAQPRFTLDASAQTRRSLAVRFRQVHTQLLPISSISKLPYRLIPFANVEGLTGAFITGDKPHWILADEKHPIRAFALKQAAMAFAKTTHLGGAGEYFIRIEDGSFVCYLPPSLNTDFAMPCDRFEMERVYSNVAFDPPSAHYVGATAISVPFQMYDEEGEIILGPEGETLIPPLIERSSLELFSQGSNAWRVIDGHDFEQNESVLCVESVNLESSSSVTGFKDFIAVGTGLNFAEDRASRGNVYIFEIVETVPGTEKGPSGWRLKLRCKDPARNPVSAIGNINGYLMHSNGPKVFVKGLDFDERLMGLAFLDVMLYVTSIRVFKNLIIIGDLVKSLWFVTFQEDPFKFTIVAKDLQPVSVLCGDFLVHEGQMSFISNDRFGEMRMIDFDPTDPDSLNGEKLILKTEFHTGAAVTASKSIARRKTAEEEWAPQTQLIYATHDGSLTTLVSVKSARFKRLQLVSDQLIRNAQHVAGLNPRAFRTVRNDLVPKPLSKGILDGALLRHFALQPIKRQREMMRQIGTDAVTVASDLQALGGFW
ncbi:cleavage and polyadenylation specificity factor subunit 1, partial [Tremellales sp. Uapishka_1]